MLVLFLILFLSANSNIWFISAFFFSSWSWVISFYLIFHMSSNYWLYIIYLILYTGYIVETLVSGVFF